MKMPKICGAIAPLAPLLHWPCRTLFINIKSRDIWHENEKHHELPNLPCDAAHVNSKSTICFDVEEYCDKSKTIETAYTCPGCQKQINA